MKSASASCPEVSEPASSIALAEMSDQDSHEGGIIHPKRMPGARRLLADPMYKHAIGRETLERSHPFAAELGVIVVLDDEPVAALGPLDQCGASWGAHHRAGGELVRRCDHDRVGVAAREHGHVDAVGVDGDRCHLQARLLGDEPLRVPAWVLQRDPLDPLTPEPAARERETLVKTGADDQLLSVGGHSPDATEVVGQRLTQLRGAARISVADRVERRVAPREAHGAQPAVTRETVDVGDPGGEVIGEPREQGWSRQPGGLGADRAGDAETRSSRGQACLHLGSRHSSARHRWTRETAG